ncbi:uncharacterized protein LOC102706809 [Oryza brachyantha]|uniref:Uncharacterized protein n=1 Tax=Oryza brachyantha TaxID=4533 RepID=J3KUD9_ORYBR|nr:uncharacterized protein LOC102706809 [Oryza brachyantha]
MAREPKHLLALLLCLMFAQGSSVCLRCMNDHVVVSQRVDDHGEDVGGGGGGVVQTSTLYMFKVTVTNRCCCEVRSVVVAAPGFQSAIPIDPKLFRPNSGEGETDYLVGDGGTIPVKGNVTFAYTWSTVFRMDVVSMTVFRCL